MAVLGTVGFRYIGVYDATKEYVTGNVVTYDGSSYVMIKYASDGVSKTAVTGVAPDADDTTWKIMAEGISESKADAKLKEAVSTAEASAKKWAVGNDESITEGSDTDNAKYYAAQAKASADKAMSISDVGIATTSTAGIVKPDGDTITIDEDGTIHGVSKITVDDALSDTSENPVQNKAIKAAIDAQKETIATQGKTIADHTTAIEAKADKTALDTKQDKMTKWKPVFPATWAQTDSIWSASITEGVDGITADTDVEIVGFESSGTASTDATYKTALGTIISGVTAENSVTLYASEQPSVTGFGIVLRKVV